MQKEPDTWFAVYRLLFHGVLLLVLITNVVSSVVDYITSTRVSSVIFIGLIDIVLPNRQNVKTKYSTRRYDTIKHLSFAAKLVRCEREETDLFILGEEIKS